MVSCVVQLVKLITVLLMVATVGGSVYWLLITNNVITSDLIPRSDLPNNGTMPEIVSKLKSGRIIMWIATITLSLVGLVSIYGILKQSVCTTLFVGKYSDF